ncbi:MAG: ATP/GTP-binding protein [Epsilonproteobacteria bacterium]|nr:ATP/GTP-binding protein [Campylobacterota bacterium]
MTSISMLNVTSNQFGFTLQTSSGDTIELSMYDNKSISFEKEQNQTSRNTTMSLRHEYGYRFSYKGNGIDERDQKEIEEAMKRIRPMFQNFLENVKKSDEIPGFQEITNLSQLFRDQLPSPQTEDATNLLKERTLDTADDILALFDYNDRLLESAKALFDKLFEQNRAQFDFFA